MYHTPAIFNESSTSLLVILLSRLEPAALGCTAVISPDRPIPCAYLSKNATEKSTECGQKYTEPQYLKIDQDYICTARSFGKAESCLHTVVCPSLFSIV